MSATAVPEVTERGRTLLEIARESIRHAILGTPVMGRDEAWLYEPGATFVTVRCRGRLRGCLGSLDARLPLVDDLRHNAEAAATRDPRFPPIAREELAELRVEVSLLSPLEEVPCASEAEAVRAMAGEHDGWVLELGRHKGTFLPQVWESLPDPADFLARLKEKAGLPADFWDPGIRLWRYRVSKWIEPGAWPEVD